ncbi:MAG: HAMP domain-containing histidine kinase [Silvanigrellaceae bacterium]|nr:HAMP domain-containing histidine kinase [Silvanigrellaceae bacterium]
MGIKKNSQKSIKSYILEFLILASLLPLFIFSLLFTATFQNVNKKIQENETSFNNNIRHEFGIFLNKISSKTSIIVDSSEMKKIIHILLEQENFSSQPISELKYILKEHLPFINDWKIISNKGKLLYENSFSSQPIMLPQISFFSGFYFDKKQNVLFYFQPIFHESLVERNLQKTDIGRLVILLPLNLIREKFPSLMRIENISPDLSTMVLNLEKNPSPLENTFFYQFYIFIFLVFILIIFSVYLITKKLQNKIIQPIIALSNDILQKMDSYPEKIEIQKNEIIFLQNTFYQYISYMEKLQKEISEKSKLAAIGEVAQMLAHDIRKPFYSMNIILENLNAKSNLNDIKNELSHVIPEFHKSLKNIDFMLKDILEFSTTTLNINEPSAIEEILLTCLNELTKIFSSKKINFIYHLHHEYRLFVDPSKVYRVISNILTNSFEALGETGGTITFETASKNDGWICVAIENDGPSIEPTDLEKIFAPHFTRHKKQGTGLGLAICKKFIQLHGGEISMQNLSQSKGVKTVFTLPCETNKVYTPRIEQLPAATYQTNSLKPMIVLIEDDPFVARSWQKALQNSVELIIFENPDLF